MSDSISIDHEGLQEASNDFSTIAESISEQTQLLHEVGLSMQEAWLGVGSSGFMGTNDLINSLMEKTYTNVKNESMAATTANRRFEEVDAEQARAHTELTKFWTTVFGE